MSKIKDARKKAHLSQEQLASQTGLSKGYISLLETQKRQPSLTAARKLVSILPGLTAVDVLNDTPHETTSVDKK